MKKPPPKHNPYLDHDEVTIEMLREDPEFAAAYLNTVLDEGDQAEFMRAMRRMAEACGGVPQVANRAKLHPKTLYRTLSPQGNPELRTLTTLLKKMGLRIAVEPVKSVRRRRTGAAKKSKEKILKEK